MMNADVERVIPEERDDIIQVGRDELVGRIDGCGEGDWGCEYGRAERWREYRLLAHRGSLRSCVGAGLIVYTLTRDCLYRSCRRDYHHFSILDEALRRRSLRHLLAYKPAGAPLLQ